MKGKEIIKGSRDQTNKLPTEVDNQITANSLGYTFSI